MEELPEVSVGAGMNQRSVKKLKKNKKKKRIFL